MDRKDRKRISDRDRVTLQREPDRSRRKVLKTLATGGTLAGALALTGKWSRPVVDTVILPAHAQATNATTGTPPVTTTSGACSPRLDSAYYTVSWDPQTHTVSSVTVFGTVTPAVPGANIVMDFGVLYVDNSSGHYTLNASTDATGAYTATQTFTAADQVMDVGGPGVVGPCGDTRDAQPAHAGTH